MEAPNGAVVYSNGPTGPYPLSVFISQNPILSNRSASKMPTEPANYEAVLADLQEKRDQIDAAIAAIRLIMGTPNASAIATNGVQKVPPGEGIPHDAFLTLSTSDAAVKYLEMVRSAQTLSQIYQGLQAGGLDVTYNAVQIALSRRADKVGDVANRNGKWVLTQWHPTYQKRTKNSSKKSKRSKKRAAGSQSPKRDGSGITLLGGTEEILRKAGKPIHADEIIKKLADLGKVTNKPNLTATLRQDTKHRFTNLGKNLWALAEWPAEVLRKAQGETPLLHEI